METRTDQSYGVIPLRKSETGYEVLLIDQYVHDGGSYWGFPKGHSEEGESPETSALRELEEETGITEVTLDMSRTFEQAYSFVYEGARIEKRTIFFLGTVHAGALTLQADEVRDARWLPLSAVRDHLTYDDTKKLWDDARAYIEQKPASVIP